MRIFIITLFVLYGSYALAQTDSSVVLSYADYIGIVLHEHPSAKQADIKISEGKATLLYARGAFDPKAYTNVGQKYFKGDQYYSNINGGLKVPTWFGVELKGGYEQSQGVFLNPENTTPANGLLYAGISVPVGQGLLIDKRRAELKKARLFQQVSEMEKQIILNQLVFVAGTAYWKWFKAYHALQVYEDAYRLATERADAVKLGANIGDRPAVDTLEAGIQVQNRMLSLQQARVEFTNAGILLSVYLWDQGVVPLELAEGTVPISIAQNRTLISQQPTLSELDSLVNNHPQLNKTRVKIKQFEVDRRLKMNLLLPVINLKYNPLTEVVGNQTFANLSINNYTWGLEFQMPLILRKERGALKLTNLKIQDQNLQLSNKQQTLSYKVAAAWNQWNATREQIDLYAQTVEDAGNLLKAERQLFNMGESSLFMVNSREVGYIKTQLKFIQLKTVNRTAELTTKYALGSLAN